MVVGDVGALAEVVVGGSGILRCFPVVLGVGGFAQAPSVMVVMVEE